MKINFFLKKILKDIYIIFINSVIISFGISLIHSSGTLIGSTAGIAFIISYIFSISFGIIFFLINIPFYFFSIFKMGIEFTIKTFVSIILVSIITKINSLFISLIIFNKFYTTFLGNIFIGIGLISLFKNNSSLGGINIISLCIKNKYKIKIGNIQMIIDILIFIFSYFFISFPAILYSIFGAIILNLILSINYNI
ncbi:YitT family protein [Candidatus Annandia pinicola]|uniref:YitT family protein n=1 Tax=Candidatus Annandia pinicola TaxID=1345117 RepID=UPI002A4E11B4|nr:YitT family protein [Candidatus Annandia pinicola]